MQKLLCLLLCLFSALWVYSQNVLDSARQETLRLQHEGVDTIVTLGRIRTRFSDLETSKQLHTIAVEESTFIFYKRNGKTFVKRCMSFADSTGRFGTYAISKPMMVAADSVLNWVAADADQIICQPIGDYIYERKVDSVNTVYELNADHHPIRILLSFYIKENKPGISFSLGDLDYLSGVYSPENLNYLYNIKTPCYKLFLTLEKISNSVKNDLKY